MCCSMRDCLCCFASLSKTFCLALLGMDDDNATRASFDPLRQTPPFPPPDSDERGSHEKNGTLSNEDMKSLRDFLRSTK